ncbi:hypothetical protein CONLIGDRAFT_691738 [Coniochaeta ligniaria NRRL 30616]|uniref:Uncharacterized protein n=1 Tax=Coniochaeta ligniaria NRRL 30616 TaxID=1408157 RepID=A0A1J7I9R9_9PEZI|nr:hypothetical protein CONLIGDRAFT_691738 [Coniochaeta ligniaria NRRL 30616]
MEGASDRPCVEGRSLPAGRSDNIDPAQGITARNMAVTTEVNRTPSPDSNPAVAAVPPMTLQPQILLSSSNHSGRIRPSDFTWTPVPYSNPEDRTQPAPTRTPSRPDSPYPRSLFRPQPSSSSIFSGFGQRLAPSAQTLVTSPTPTRPSRRPDSPRAGSLFRPQPSSSTTFSGSGRSLTTPRAMPTMDLDNTSSYPPLPHRSVAPTTMVYGGRGQPDNPSNRRRHSNPSHTEKPPEAGRRATAPARLGPEHGNSSSTPAFGQASTPHGPNASPATPDMFQPAPSEQPRQDRVQSIRDMLGKTENVLVNERDVAVQEEWVQFTKDGIAEARAELDILNTCIREQGGAPTPARMEDLARLRSGINLSRRELRREQLKLGCLKDRIDLARDMLPLLQLWLDMERRLRIHQQLD